MSARKKKAAKKAAQKKTKRGPRLPKVGSVLERAYKGKTHRVTVVKGGFKYKRKTYSSLTALAKAITGYPSISGPAFFRLTTDKRKGQAR